MEKIVPSTVLALLLCFSASAQVDTIGSGHAVWFDGVDDYIDMGNIYDDIQFPITISAWIYVPSNSKYILPIFVSQDNAPLYNGFWFCVSEANLFFEYGDGRGDQNSAFRRGKSAAVGNLNNRWIYVSAVITSGQNIELYANGRNLGGAYTGSTSEPMASNYPTDIAKIGYFFTNDVVHTFYGWIDELRIWNRALTEHEIRQTMCRRLKGDELGLIGYWNFDEVAGDVLSDSSPNQLHGTLKGNPLRAYSGAPCGNESTFLYTSNWAGQSLTSNGLTVSNVSPGVYGVHIYAIPYTPSQTGGMDAEDVTLPYFGVFLADDGNEHFFDVSFVDDNVCRYWQRGNNSIAEWNPTDDFSALSFRIELIPVFGNNLLSVDLGPDLSLCNTSSVVLVGHPDPSGKSFRWNTGETSSTITVKESGLYKVEVNDGCQRDTASVAVAFEFSPPQFSLGEDQVVCAIKPWTLKPDIELEGLTLLWQDGSKDDTFRITRPGTYWLKVSNGCGESVDSLTVKQRVIDNFVSYNFISPGASDPYNQFFVIDEKLYGARVTIFNRWGKPLFESLNYQNDWDGRDLPAGIYFYMVQGDCFDPIKGTLTIAR